MRHAPAAPSRAPSPPLRRAPAPSRHLAAAHRGKLERARHPRVERVIGGLEAEHEHRGVAAAGAGVRGLERVEQPAVRRVQARLRERAHGSRAAREALARPGSARDADARKRGPILQPHPRLGDHAERALGADEEAIGLGPAPEPGRRRVSTTPVGVTTRSDSTKSSMCV